MGARDVEREGKLVNVFEERPDYLTDAELREFPEDLRQWCFDYYFYDLPSAKWQRVTDSGAGNEKG